MKYLLITFLSFLSFYVVGQTTSSADLLVNKWTQAKIDSLGNVVEADMSPGGWSSLTINKNKTVVYASSFDCGFGHARHGTWSLDAKKKTLTFNFTKKVGFLNVPGTKAIKEKEVYSIEQLTETALVLKNKAKNTTLVFRYSENNNQ